MDEKFVRLHETATKPDRVWSVRNDRTLNDRSPIEALPSPVHLWGFVGSNGVPRYGRGLRTRYRRFVHRVRGIARVLASFTTRRSPFVRRRASAARRPRGRHSQDWHRLPRSWLSTVAKSAAAAAAAC